MPVFEGTYKIPITDTVGQGLSNKSLFTKQLENSYLKTCYTENRGKMKFILGELREVGIPFLF